MAATTTDRNTPCLYPQRQTRIPLATASVIPAGVLVCEQSADGKAVNASNTAGLRVIGRSEHSASQTAGDEFVVVGRGVYGFAGSSALIALGQAACGQKVYVVDNQTVGLASDASARVVAGVLDEIEGSVFYVNVNAAGTASTGSDVATVADAAVSPAVADASPLIVTPILIPDAATADYDYIVRDKQEIIDVLVIKDAAGAGNTIQVKNGAGTAITDAIAAAVDKTKTQAGTIDKATRVLAAGATLRITATRAAGSMAAAVFIHSIRRA